MITRFLVYPRNMIKWVRLRLSLYFLGFKLHSTKCLDDYRALQKIANDIIKLYQQIKTCSSGN